MLLQILKYPDPRLFTIAEDVLEDEIKSEHTKNIISDMFETMYVSNGIGLAATQVNIHKRIIVMDHTGPEREAPIHLINPVIVDGSGNERYKEGCLSFPNVKVFMDRRRFVTISYFNCNGDRLQKNFYDIEAVCIQHEMDHLNGVTFVDNLSPLKKELVLRKIKKS